MEWLKVKSLSPGIGVDREKNVIRGFVVAQLGHFKSKGRGQFDERSLQQIVDLGAKKPEGLKSRLAHPTLSEDGVGKFLGRAKDLRIGEAIDRTGQTVKAVRGDLHLNPSSFKTPNGDLGGYVMDLAESDPGAFSSSLVLQATKEQVLGNDGKPAKNDKGEHLPPIWRPTELHASDVVDTGDAVDGFLSMPIDGENAISIEGLPDIAVRQAAQILAAQFPDTTRDELKSKLHAWLDRYLSWRFGEADEKPAEPPKELRNSREREIDELMRQAGLTT